MISLLLQPLGPFILAIAAGLMAGLAATRGHVLAFAVIVLVAAFVVAVLDLLANLRAQWGATPTDVEGASAISLAHVVWELLTANVVVIGVVGAAVYGMSLVLR